MYELSTHRRADAVAHASYALGQGRALAWGSQRRPPEKVTYEQGSEGRAARQARSAHSHLSWMSRLRSREIKQFAQNLRAME